MVVQFLNTVNGLSLNLRNHEFLSLGDFFRFSKNIDCKEACGVCSTVNVGQVF